MGDFEPLFPQLFFEARVAFSRFNWMQTRYVDDLPDVGQGQEGGAIHRQLLLCQQGPQLHVEVHQKQQKRE